MISGVRLSRRQRQLLQALSDTNVVNDFELHFQPLLTSDGACLLGVEALLRWHSPEHGWVSPAEFIPLAERYQVIQPITLWVIKTAIATLARWQQQGLALHMSLNVSVLDLEGGYLLEVLLPQLRHYQLRAETITLEVTETMAIRCHHQAARRVAELREAGFNVALDDFGSGFADLRQLVTLPVNRLKIDRSLVQSVADQENWKQMLLGVVSMAHKLGLEVVAEGVDSARACLVLQECGCDYLQGFYLARPLSETELLRWLQHHALVMTTASRRQSAQYLVES